MASQRKRNSMHDQGIVCMKLYIWIKAEKCNIKYDITISWNFCKFNMTLSVPFLSTSR
jgi:glutathione peroxidase-family protein